MHNRLNPVYCRHPTDRVTHAKAKRIADKLGHQQVQPSTLHVVCACCTAGILSVAAFILAHHSGKAFAVVATALSLRLYVTEAIADCFYALSEVNLVSGRYQEASSSKPTACLMICEKAYMPTLFTLAVLYANL